MTMLVDVVLLLDKSGSIQGYEQGVVRFAQETINSFTLGNSTVKIGVIVFDGRSKTLAPLTDSADLLRNAVKEFVGGGASVCVCTIHATIPRCQSCTCQLHTNHATVS